MTIDELKRIKVSVSFEEIETTLDQLLNKSELKKLAKDLQGERDSFVIQDVVTGSVLDNLSVDDITVDNLEVKW